MLLQCQSPAWLALLVLGGAGLGGCRPDLPAGWEGAEPIADFRQSSCEGSPYEPYETEVTATAEPPGIRVVAAPVAFRCAQDVEGFLRRSSDSLDVLLQPIDMDPEVVAGCDCLYSLEAGLPADPPALVTVWRRWDNLNDPNDPVQVGSAEVE